MQVCFPLGSRHSRHHYKVEAGNALSKTIAKGALQVTDNETNNFQHMLFKKNCSISISCAMWGSVACKHKARQGLHQPAGRPAGRPANGPRIGGDPPPPLPPPHGRFHSFGMVLLAIPTISFVCFYDSKETRLDAIPPPRCHTNPIPLNYKCNIGCYEMILQRQAKWACLYLSGCTIPQLKNSWKLTCYIVGHHPKKWCPLPSSPGFACYAQRHIVCLSPVSLLVLGSVGQYCMCFTSSFMSPISTLPLLTNHNILRDFGK